MESHKLALAESKRSALRAEAAQEQRINEATRAAQEAESQRQNLFQSCMDLSQQQQSLSDQLQDARGQAERQKAENDKMQKLMQFQVMLLQPQ